MACFSSELERRPFLAPIRQQLTYRLPMVPTFPVSSDDGQDVDHQIEQSAMWASRGSGPSWLGPKTLSAARPWMQGSQDTPQAWQTAASEWDRPHATRICGNLCNLRLKISF
jgi:hypothetical protein